MGIYKELQKFCGASVHNYIAAARTVQGFEDWKVSDKDERQKVILRWREIQPELAAEKEHNTFHSPRSLLKHDRKSSFDDGKKKSGKRDSLSKKNPPSSTRGGFFSKHRSTSLASSTTGISHIPSTPQIAPTNPVVSTRDPTDVTAAAAAFEEAMQASAGYALPQTH